MLVRKQKEELVKKIKEKIKNSELIVFCNFESLPVEKQTELKNKYKKAGGEIFVAKRRLIQRALSENKIDFPEIKGSVMVGIANHEILPAKIVFDLKKKKPEKIEFIGGLVNENGKYTILKKEEVEEIAKLLSREELLAKFIGVLKAPISRLEYVLTGNLQKLIYVLSEASKAS